MLASACAIGSRRSGPARSTLCCSRLTAPASARCLARDCRTGVNTARILTLSALFPGLRPLRHRDFALYFSGLTVSQCGDWIEATTTSWLLYQITGDPVFLGLGGGIRAASIILFGL